MPDSSFRADPVNVEEIMAQIRARIRERRGVDYTEREIQELAAARLEQLLDPGTVSPDLLNGFRRLQQGTPGASSGDSVLFQSGRAWVRGIRRLLRPVLKLLLNPAPLVDVLRLRERHELTFMVMHNLVVELTRLSIEVRTLKMQVESLSSRLDFDERRARSTESAAPSRFVATEAPARPSEGQAAATPKDHAEPAAEPGGGAARAQRRRRRRGRKGAGDRAWPDLDTRPEQARTAEVAGQAPDAPGPDKSGARAANDAPRPPVDRAGDESEPGS